MQYLQIILALAAAASALDIRMRTASGCGGQYYVACTNVNPNQCCFTNSGTRYPSVGFTPFPSNWRIQVKGYTGGGCNNLQSVQLISGVTNYCLSDPQGFATFSGGGYNFASTKRDDSAPDCTSSVTPNVLVLEDGTEYDISDMSESLTEELV